MSSCLASVYIGAPAGRLFCPAGVLAELLSMMFRIAPHSELLTLAKYKLPYNCYGPATTIAIIMHPITDLIE